MLQKGELLAAVRFDRKVHEELAAILQRHEARKLGPHGAAVIIRCLEEMAVVIPALAAPDRAATRLELETEQRAVRKALRAVQRRSVMTDHLIAGELKLRGWDASQFMRGLQEGLGELDRAITAIGARASRHRVRRRQDVAARWLVEQTSRILREAGISVKDNEDGTWAKVLGILWPALLKRGAPIEFRPWFKFAKSRR